MSTVFSHLRRSRFLQQEPTVQQRSHQQPKAGYTSILQISIDIRVDQSTAARALRLCLVEGEGQLKQRRSFTHYDTWFFNHPVITSKHKKKTHRKVEHSLLDCLYIRLHLAILLVWRHRRHVAALGTSHDSRPLWWRPQHDNDPNNANKIDICTDCRLVVLGSCGPTRE